MVAPCPPSSRCRRITTGGFGDEGSKSGGPTTLTPILRPRATPPQLGHVPIRFRRLQRGYVFHGSVMSPWLNARSFPHQKPRVDGSICTFLPAFMYPLLNKQTHKRCCLPGTAQLKYCIYSDPSNSSVLSHITHFSFHCVCVRHK